jgi:hypothetical protein
MLRADFGVPAPCHVCPKAVGGQPLDDDADYGPWFWDARGWFHECRAVGDFGSPDPLMRAVAAEFDRADRRERQNTLLSCIAVLAAKRK